MDKNYIISLVTFSLLLLSTASFAERPAAAEEDVAPVTVENNLPETDMRPAAADSMPENTEAMTTTSTTQTSGDVLGMPTQPADTEAVAQAVKQLDFPRRGMTQDKVENELGRPLEIVPAVGQPPISRWVYNDRVVYFEYSSVIHVVAK